MCFPWGYGRPDVSRRSWERMAEPGPDRGCAGGCAPAVPRPGRRAGSRSAPGARLARHPPPLRPGLPPHSQFRDNGVGCAPPAAQNLPRSRHPSRRAWRRPALRQTAAPPQPRPPPAPARPPRPVAEGMARASAGHQVDWLSLLSAQPDWPQRCRRARLKQQLPAQLMSSGQQETDRLLGWFFGERLGWPADLAGFPPGAGLDRR